jgi:hypothetical protein
MMQRIAVLHARIQASQEKPITIPFHQAAHTDVPTAQSSQRRAHEAFTGKNSAADDTA